MVLQSWELFLAFPWCLPWCQWLGPGESTFLCLGSLPGESTFLCLEPKLFPYNLCLSQVKQACTELPALAWASEAERG